MRGATTIRDTLDTVGVISIHAPHAGSDTVSPFISLRCFLFQSTLPMRGATLLYQKDAHSTLISIHAPHAGSDLGYLQAIINF